MEEELFLDDDVWLNGWYDPTLIDDWELFVSSWSEDDEAEMGFVYLPPGQYSHEEVWELINIRALEVHGRRRRMSD